MNDDHPKKFGKSKKSTEKSGSKKRTGMCVRVRMSSIPRSSKQQQQGKTYSRSVCVCAFERVRMCACVHRFREMCRPIDRQTKTARHKCKNKCIAVMLYDISFFLFPCPFVRGLSSSWARSMICMCVVRFGGRYIRDPQAHTRRRGRQSAAGNKPVGFAARSS